MLLRVNIHEKYVRAENNEAIYFLKQIQFIIAGAPGKGRMVRGAPSIVGAGCSLPTKQVTQCFLPGNYFRDDWRFRSPNQAFIEATFLDYVPDL